MIVLGADGRCSNEGGLAMCRCKERREALVSAAKSVAKGDADGVANQLQFVGRSSIEDIANLFSRGVAASKQRLLNR
ncbi:hypothetical protein [Rhodopseudomonas palustris]|uniref:hypothetical protein n=1 Tax=Rhodopseudomonas palustris TaxID=1076 RepID=UPI0011B032EE|nr:hypothetical protein [Rhodopseudomonas palustris]